MRTSSTLSQQEASMLNGRTGVVVARLGRTRSLLMLTAILACLVVAAPASAEWFSDQFDDLDLAVWVIGFDAMLRYPLMKSPEFPNGRLQPYVTIGPAIFVAHAEDSRNFEPSNQSDTDASAGVKVGGGVAWQFTKNIAMFGEYRYTHFSPEFTFRDDVRGNAELSTDVNTHYLLVGVSFRF